MAPGRHPLRRTLQIAIPVVAAASLISVVGVRYADGASTDPDRYVTTAATTGSVTQTLQGSGTLSKIKNASVAFPAAGTVASVTVAVGDKVSASDVLATMDDDALTLARTKATSDLAAARLSLQQAEDAAAASSSTDTDTAVVSDTAVTTTTKTPESTVTATATRSARPTSSTSPTRGGSSGLDALAKAVTTAQQQLASLQQTAAQQSTAASTTCSAVTGAPTSTPTSTQTQLPTQTPSSTTPSASATSGTPSATPTGRATPSAPATTTAPDYRSCVTALTAAQRAQSDVTKQQQAVSAALQTWSAAVQKAGTSTPTASSSPTSSQPSGSTASTGRSGGSTGGTGSSARSSSAPSSGVSQSSGASSGQGSSGSGSTGRTSGGTTSVATATAAVATAKLALARATADLADATLTAPISGTISSMPFAKGDTMTTSDTIGIVGSGGVSVTIDVPETSIQQVKVGQSATVAVSAGTPSEGTVTAIGILPADATSSSASYPVTVTVAHPGVTLADGTTGTVTLTVKTVRDAVVVPVSAVTRSGTSAGSVTTLAADGSAQVTRVELGAVGATTVQITSGLTAGTRVVLAHTTAALPASNTATTRRFAR